MSNPYELRFKVLEMARELEMTQYYEIQNAFWSLYNILEQTIEKLDGKVGPEFDRVYDKATMLSQQLKQSVPAMPSTDDIKRKASELYEFVERKPKSL